MRPLLAAVAAAIGEAGDSILTFSCLDGNGRGRAANADALSAEAAAALDAAVRDWCRAFQAEAGISILNLQGSARPPDVAALATGPDVPMSPMPSRFAAALHARPPAFWKGRGTTRYLAHASIPWDYGWNTPSPVRVTASDLHSDPGARKNIAARWTAPLMAWFQEHRGLFRGIGDITFEFHVDPPTAHQVMAAHATRSHARASRL